MDYSASGEASSGESQTEILAAGLSGSKQLYPARLRLNSLWDRLAICLMLFSIAIVLGATRVLVWPSSEGLRLSNCRCRTVGHITAKFLTQRFGVIGEDVGFATCARNSHTYRPALYQFFASMRCVHIG
jgi:hypothetical protein